MTFKHHVLAKYSLGSYFSEHNKIPKIVYHGTNKIFKHFDPTKRELGFHFAEKIEQAEERGKYIILAHINLKNPLHLDSDLGDWSDMEMLKDYLGEATWEIFTDEQFSKFKNVADVRQGLIKEGYDGIVYDNRFEGDGESYIAFEPSQIKIIKIVKRDTGELP